MIRIKEFLNEELITIGDHHITMSQIMVVVVVVAITWISIKGLKKVIVNRGNFSELERGRRLSVFKLFQYVLWVIVFLLTLEGLGFEITLLLAGSAALLVGVGPVSYTHLTLPTIYSV